MSRPALPASPPPPAHIDCWVFDLDNTLYPPELGLFARIDQRMGAFIMRTVGCDAAEARVIQKRYFHDHGTTLAGMMRHHGVEAETFLTFVHDIDMDDIPNDPELPLPLNKVHPIHEVVKVDYFMPGCPPSGDAIWKVLTDLLAGREPTLEHGLMHYD